MDRPGQRPPTAHIRSSELHPCMRNALHLPSRRSSSPREEGVPLAAGPWPGATGEPRRPADRHRLADALKVRSGAAGVARSPADQPSGGAATAEMQQARGDDGADRPGGSRHRRGDGGRLPQPNRPASPSFPDLAGAASVGQVAAGSTEDSLAVLRENSASTLAWLREWRGRQEASEASVREWLREWKDQLHALMGPWQGDRLLEVTERAVREQLDGQEERIARRVARMNEEHSARLESLLSAKAVPSRHRVAQLEGQPAQGDEPKGGFCEADQSTSAEDGSSRAGSKLTPSGSVKVVRLSSSVETFGASPRREESQDAAPAAQPRLLRRSSSQHSLSSAWDEELQDEPHRQASASASRSLVDALLAAQGWVKSAVQGEPETRMSPSDLSRSSFEDMTVSQQLRMFVKQQQQFENATDRNVQVMSILLVALNTIYMGVQVSVCLDNVQEGRDPPVIFFYLDVMFAVLFAVEIGIRLWIERWAFFWGANTRWNAFDSILALTPIVGLVLASSPNVGFLRSLRAFRAVRAARMIKSVSFVRELRLMVASILCSIGSLVWAFLLLTFVIYLVSLFFIQGVEDHWAFWNHRGEPVPSEETLRERYGSLPASMYTLFCAISGGGDWADLAKPLDDVWGGYRYVFCGYVIFVFFGILNILTAIFVESAKRIAEIDREIVIQDQMERDMSAVNTVRRIFNRADEDHDGKLTREELGLVLGDVKTKQHLALLELDINEVEGLFHLLDIDDQNAVVIDEFVMQLMRLKGGAKGLDLQTVLYENKRIFVRLTAMMRFVEKHLAMVENALDVRAGTISTMSDFVQSEEQVAGHRNNFFTAGY